MSDDWNTDAVGGRSWSKDSQIVGLCKDDQYVGWPGYPGFDSDKTDWHGSTSAAVYVPSLPVGSYKTGCFRQHHMRFWDDQEHLRVTKTGHTANDWVVAGIHHEYPAFKVPCCTHHIIDRDWDRVRVEFTKAMSKHCTVRRWKYHPEADTVLQGYDNSGYLARISLRHRSEGCSGA